MPKIIGTRSDARNVEMLSKVRLSMISSFAAAAPAPWMAAATTFVDAEIVKIGKSWLKRRRWRTTARWLESG